MLILSATLFLIYGEINNSNLIVEPGEEAISASNGIKLTKCMRKKH